MSEQPTSPSDDWSDQAVLEDEPKKRRIPGWVWGCGCGCLAAAVIAALALGWLFREVSGLFDPEKQWERIGELLPYDERPSNIEPIFAVPQIGAFFGLEKGGISFCVMKDSSLELVGVLIEFAGDAGEAVDDLFGKDAKGGGPDLKDEARGALSLQGRDTRFLSGFGESPYPFGGSSSEGAQLWVDLTVEGAEPLVLMLVDVPEAKADARETIATEDVEDFLRGFRVWDRP